MKTLILLLIPFLSFAQPFASAGLVNQGASFKGGITANNIVLEGMYVKPLTSTTANRIAALNVGIRIKDLVNVTIGGASLHRMDFTKYDLDPTGKTGPETINEVKGIYGIEVSHSWWYLDCHYFGSLIYGAGVKINFTKK